MQNFHFTSCGECKQLHEPTNLCLLGRMAPESINDTRMLAAKYGPDSICRMIEKSDYLLDSIERRI